MIDEGEVFEFEARNPLPKFNRRKIGDVYHVNLEISEEMWEQLKLIPPSAILAGRLFWHLGDDPKIAEKAERQVKGEFGTFWAALCKKGVLNNLDLRQALDKDAANPQETKYALYEQFGVTSLSQIHPSDFARWAAQNHLVNLVVMAEEVANAGVH